MELARIDAAGLPYCFADGDYVVRRRGGVVAFAGAVGEHIVDVVRLDASGAAGEDVRIFVRRGASHKECVALAVEALSAKIVEEEE